jgi:four helix bundle protein
MKGDDLAARLLSFAANSIRTLDRLPFNYASRHIANQAIRSTSSAGANYEEARSAESRRDFVHKLGVALKEIQESVYWLQLANELYPAADFPILITEASELCRIIARSRITAQQNGV